MKQTLRFENWPPPVVTRSLSPNGSRQQHWATKRFNVHRVQERTALTARAQGLRPMLGLVTVTATWTFPVKRTRDPDNLSGGGVIKATIDSLVRGGWLAGDSTEHVILMPVEVRVEPRVRRLELRFEEVERSAESSAQASGLPEGRNNPRSSTT